MNENIILKQIINDKNFEKKFDAIIINNDKPITITKKEYCCIEGEPQYTDAEKERKIRNSICDYKQKYFSIIYQ